MWNVECNKQCVKRNVYSKVIKLDWLTHGQDCSMDRLQKLSISIWWLLTYKHSCITVATIDTTLIELSDMWKPLHNTYLITITSFYIDKINSHWPPLIMKKTPRNHGRNVSPLQVSLSKINILALRISLKIVQP